MDRAHDSVIFVLQEAQAAQTQTNGYKLDKNHIFAVSMFDDFEKYNKVPEEYAPAEKKAYVPRVSHPRYSKQYCLLTQQANCTVW